MPRHQTPAQKETVERVMHEFKHGELKTARGTAQGEEPEAGDRDSAARGRRVKRREPGQEQAQPAPHQGQGAARRDLSRRGRGPEGPQAKSSREPRAAEQDQGGELYAEAKRRNIHGRSKMDKAAKLEPRAPQHRWRPDDKAHSAPSSTAKANCARRRLVVASGLRPQRRRPRRSRRDGMQFGFNLPNSGAAGDARRSWPGIAREGEALGYDYLTVTDHVVLPDMAEPGYPYSESGAFYSTDSAHRHEMLTLAAWLAAKTARLRLVLAVLVVPHRPAVLAAKQLATIDVLSGGRLTVGIGAGWLKAEFDAVVTTPFAERGAVTDEYVDAFRDAVDREEAADRRPVRPVQRAVARTEAGAAAAPADLGRRRERPVDAPRRPARRRLVSDRHQQRAPARHAAALPRRHRAAAPR